MEKIDPEFSIKLGDETSEPKDLKTNFGNGRVTGELNNQCNMEEEANDNSDKNEKNTG